MKISEVISYLHKIKDANGDMDVVIIDADTQWEFTLKEIHFDVDSSGEGKYLTIGCDYGDEIY